MERRPNDLREPEGGHMRRVKEIVKAREGKLQRIMENINELWAFYDSEDALLW